MFPYLSALFLVTFLFQSSVSIKCIDKEVEWNTEKVLRDTTCEGNLCMNFLNGDQIDKTCITTGAFNISNGCIQYDDLDEDLVVCFCNTDLCNSSDKPTTPPVVMKQSNCVAALPGEKPTNTMAPMCSVRITAKGGTHVITKTADTDFEVVLPVPVTRQASLHEFSYHVGVIHTTSGIHRDTIHHHYKCFGEKCNDLQIKDTVSERVKCHTNGADHCTGEFCVFATNGTILKYCLSTVSVSGDHHYEVGIFKYKSSTFYLCNKDFCNSDEETAKTSLVPPKPEISPEDVVTKVVPGVVTEVVKEVTEAPTNTEAGKDALADQTTDITEKSVNKAELIASSCSQFESFVFLIYLVLLH